MTQLMSGTGVNQSAYVCVNNEWSVGLMQQDFQSSILHSATFRPHTSGQELRSRSSDSTHYIGLCEDEMRPGIQSA